MNQGGGTRRKTVQRAASERADGPGRRRAHRLVSCVICDSESSFVGQTARHVRFVAPRKPVVYCIRRGAFVPESRCFAIDRVNSRHDFVSSLQTSTNQ